MKDEFRTTFSVSIEPDRVWPELARRPEDHGQSAIESEPGTQVWLPGWEMTAEVLKVVPGEQLLLRKDAQPCKGTEILIQLEHEDTGTRLTVVQSGFGAFFDKAVDSLAIGADFIFKDLALYLETGVFAHRHLNAWGPGFGAFTRETPTGLLITQVTGDGIAARAGLRAGDRLISFAGASIGNTRDLSVALRTQRGVKEVELYWVRDREKAKGSATL
jgi:uncharacterized protein YndB with AHSA1/START domain